MDAVVAGELRMERRRKDRALTHEHGLVIDASKYIDGLTGALDDRRSDEDAVERLVETVDSEVGLEAVDLAPERVAAHVHVEHAEADLVVATVEDLLSEENE